MKKLHLSAGVSTCSPPPPSRDLPGVVLLHAAAATAATRENTKTAANLVRRFIPRRPLSSRLVSLVQRSLRPAPANDAPRRRRSLVGLAGVLVRRSND